MAQQLKALTVLGSEFNSQQPHVGSQPSIMVSNPSGVSEDSNRMFTYIK